MSYPTLLSAAVARLRTSTALLTLLHENRDLAGGTKIWIDIVNGKPLFPWMVLIQLGEDHSFQSVDGLDQPHYFGAGSFQAAVFGHDSDQVSQIQTYVIALLTDAPLVFTDGRLLELRVAHTSGSGEFVTEPRKQLIYHGYIEFHYMIERTLT